MNLDKYQKNAVYAKERNLLVVAAPGSGKTTVIINRIRHLVKDESIKTDNIIVITFTKAAALNMKDRYIKTFRESKAPFFGTFHGLFYKILSRAGYNIKIIEEFKVRKLIENILKKYFDEINEDRVKEIINNISLFKTARVDIKEFNPSMSKDIFIECLEGYNKLKESEGLWDFDDLAIKVLKELKENEGLLRGYRNLFKFILVDEFQDCDNLQVEFLKLINEGENNSLFCVGDEDQCIYSFRGSRPEYMMTFSENFKDGKKYYLSINYRSRDNIVKGSKSVIKNNKDRNDKKIESFRKETGEIKIFKPLDERVQGELVCKEILRRFEMEGVYKNNIVLYRTNTEAMGFIDAFTRNKIPFNLLDKEYNFFNHFICKDLIAYLKLALDLSDKESFARVINKPFRYVSKVNIEHIKRHKEDKNPFDILIEKKETPPFQKDKLDDLKKDINYLNKITLGSAIQYIISDLEYIEHIKTYSEKFGHSMEDLEVILDEFKNSASEFRTILEFFEHIEKVTEEIEKSKKNNDEDRVLLSTIHRVKGMEFKNVYLVNCIEEIMPHSSAKEEEIEEERRIFYVAITRAIDNLYLFAPSCKGNKVREESRFLKETEFKRDEIKKLGIVEGAKVIHLGRGEEGVIKSIKGNRIEIIFKNNVGIFDLNILLERMLLKII